MRQENPRALGARLKRARRELGLTQAQVAERLAVTQAYVSMLERGRRAVPSVLKVKVEAAYRVEETTFSRSATDRSGEVAKSLATLGYEPLGYLRSHRRLNPGEVLLEALRESDLESRVVEGLPWVLLRYPDLDWHWLLREAKLADVQNRLGFVVSLARQVAELHQDAARAGQLQEREELLRRSRLAREDTLCHESLTQAERRWLREQRSPEAHYWNLLTGLRANQLSYGP